MAEYQRIVDEIQQLLEAGFEHAESRAASVNAEYVEAVQEVNDRLRACSDLLRRGLRSEAIRQGEAEPRLLESVAILDFPDKSVWLQVVEHLRLPKAPDLNVDCAGALNEAYAAEEPLHALLRVHRLLALGRAGLSERIKVLRRIRQVDPDKSVWEEDLREYEKVRLGQILPEMSEAESRDDLEKLSSLVVEVRCQDSLLRIPDATIDQIVRAYNRVNYKLARLELVQLANDMHEAYAALDLDRGRRLRSAWNAKAAIGLNGERDELVETVAAALKWLEDQDREELAHTQLSQAVTELTVALDGGAVSRSELERLWAAACRFDQPLDPIVENRVIRRFRDLDIAAARRNRLLILSAILGVAVVGAVVGIVAIRHIHATRCEEYAALLRATLQTGKHKEAERLLRQIETTEPSIYQRPLIQELKFGLERALVAEDERRRLLLTHLDAARTKGSGNPGIDSIRQAEADLEKAKKLARSDGELAEILELARQLTEAEERLRRAATESFTSEVETLQSRFKSLDRKDSSALEALVADARKCYQGHLYASQAVRDAILPAMIKQIEVLIDGVRENRVQEECLRKITSAVGSNGRFQQALESYNQNFGKPSPRTKDFARVLKTEIALWPAVDAWNQFLQELCSYSLLNIGEPTARLLLGKVAALRSQYPTIPAPEAIEERVKYLEAVCRRVSDSKKSHIELLDTFRVRTMSELSVIKRTTGERDYFVGEAMILKESVIVYALKSLGQPDERVRVIVPREQIANAPNGTAYDWTSAQARYSKLAIERLQGLTDDRWESTFFSLIEALINEEEMDPIVKLAILETVLHTGCQGSRCLELVFKPYLEVLEGAELDKHANWLSPDDEAARQARATAELVLGRLPPISNIAAAATQLRATLELPRTDAKKTWCGWLRRNDDGSWACEMPMRHGANLSGELFVLDVPANSKETAFTSIGTLANGQASHLASALTTFVEGRAVFLVPEETNR